MKVKDIMRVLQEIAPVEYAEKWDNVGLLVGDEQREVKRILVALDPTTSVIEQAISQKCDMLITHHPLLFSPIKSVTKNDFIGRRVMALIENKIAYSAMHTNMDIAVMADVSSERVGLLDAKVLDPIKGEDAIGIGRYGSLIEEMTLLQLSEIVKQAFSLESVRIIGDFDKRVSKVAISTGSGEDYVDQAIKVGVDVLITGDIRYHKAVDALEKGLCVIDAGHFGTEQFMVDWLVNRLRMFMEESGEALQVLSALEKSPFCNR